MNNKTYIASVPPTESINPVEIVEQEFCARNPARQTESPIIQDGGGADIDQRQGTQRRPAAPIIPSVVDANSQPFGFGAAMENYLLRQTQSRRQVDITTIQGFQQALRGVLEDSQFEEEARPTLVTHHVTSNLTNMYIDPETGDECHLIDGRWHNSQPRRPISPIRIHRRTTATLINEVDDALTEAQPPVMYDSVPGEPYYLTNNRYRPLTINAQANSIEVEDYLSHTFSDSDMQTGDELTERNVHQSMSPMRDDADEDIEQLTNNINTNQVLGGTINNMTTNRIPPTVLTPGYLLFTTSPTQTRPSVAAATPQQSVPTDAQLPTNSVQVPNHLVPGPPNGVPTVPLTIHNHPVSGPPNRVPPVSLMVPDGRFQVAPPRDLFQVQQLRLPVPPPVVNTTDPGYPQPNHTPLPQVFTNGTNRRATGGTLIDLYYNRPTVERDGHTIMANPLETLSPTRERAPIVLNVSPNEQQFIPPTLPATNPYLNLPRPVLDAIAQDRDINLVGSNAERANQLYEFDHIMPEWIQAIITKNVANFQVLGVGPKYYVFGALNGVDFTDVGGLQARDLVNFIRVSILMNDTKNNANHPGRAVLTGLINGLNRNILEVLSVRIGIPRINLRFISIQELRTAIATGSTAHVANATIAIVAQRYSMLTTHRHSNLLANLYDIDDDARWINVARSAPHPLESVICNIDTFDPLEIAATFGMSIPLAHSNNTREYVCSNIVSYANVVTRGTLNPIPLNVTTYMSHQDLVEYVSKLTDQEIFSNIGVYVPYETRDELVLNTVTAIIRSRFMFPAVRSLEHSVNKVTPIIQDDITDTNIFMVCFGTALKYVTYSLDELTDSFYRDTETGVMEFRRPENVNTKFTISDIEGLRQLVSCFPMTEDIRRLINVIDEGIIDAREKIEFDDVARARMAVFDKPDQDLMKAFLRHIFYTGMYMRRWAGPGHAFPLRSKTTTDGKDPDGKVTDQLGAGMAMLDQMAPAVKTLCLTLTICEYNGQGGIDHGKAKFGAEWENVIAGRQCIRMASSKFVGTGYHYLRALFRETIPGMDVKAVDRIV